MSANDPIRLGIDIGRKACRAAYVFPDGEGQTVPVPDDTLRRVHPCYPIAVRTTTNDLYASRFFPALTQRLVRGATVYFGGRSQPTWDILGDMLQDSVEAAERFSGRKSDGILLSLPLWADASVGAAYRASLLRTERPGALCSEAEAAAAYFRANMMKGEERATVLYASAGYVGFGAAALRLAPKGARTLADGGQQGILAGNLLDHLVMQSAVKALAAPRITLADVDEPNVWAHLLLAVEDAKQEVADGDASEFHIPAALTPGEAQPVGLRLDGATFRQVVKAELERAGRIVDDVLTEADVDASEVRHVVLNGGTTHIPEVVRYFQARFPSARVQHLRPDAVAQGAALLATEGELTEHDNSAARPSMGLFVPDLPAVPGLVALSRPEAAERRPGLDEQRPVADPPVDVDGLTLAAVRAMVGRGERAGARALLGALGAAVAKFRAELEATE